MRVELDGRWSDERQGWMVAETEDYFVDILPLLYNHRIVMTPKSCPEVYDAGWCYPNLLAAAAAVLGWDYEREAEPTGYIKQVGLTAEWVRLRGCCDGRADDGQGIGPALLPVQGKQDDRTSERVRPT